MFDLVTSALAARAHEPEGWRAGLLVSVIAHGLLIGLLVFAPELFGPRASEPRTIMTISLGGAPGPVSGGLNPIAGRPVQQATPPPELPKPQSVRPPAAKTPEMTEPVPSVKPAPKTPVREAPREASGRTPTTGAQERPGQARVDTGSESNEMGLSTGGGGTGDRISLGDFCDPQYLGQMVALIRRNWNSRQPVAATAFVRYTIQRDGKLTDIQLSQSSRFQMHDMLAMRAVQLTGALPPLPACYPNPTLTVNLAFEYIR
jgi:TonB family protein